MIYLKKYSSDKYFFCYKFFDDFLRNKKKDCICYLLCELNSKHDKNMFRNLEGIKKCRLFHQDGIFLMMLIILPVAIPATESCILERAIAASCASSVQAPELTAGLGLCRVWH